MLNKWVDAEKYLQNSHPGEDQVFTPQNELTIAEVEAPLYRTQIKAKINASP